MKDDARTFFAIVAGIPLLLAGAAGTHAILAPAAAVVENTLPAVETPPQAAAGTAVSPFVPTPAPPHAALASVPVAESESIVEEPVIEYVYREEVREDDVPARAYEREYRESEQEDDD